MIENKDIFNLDMYQDKPIRFLPPATMMSGLGEHLEHFEHGVPLMNMTIIDHSILLPPKPNGEAFELAIDRIGIMFRTLADKKSGLTFLFEDL